MAQYKLPLLILFAWLLALPLGKATHIVGGEMNYTCLGNDQYEITLTIFRDCFNGNPNAWFDNPASIGIFDANNVLIEQVLVPLINNDTLMPVLTGECLVVPPDVCVHTTTYTAIVDLPPVPGGYQLAYQRCCRNQTIINIIDPLDTGATYGVTISEQALNECNSNPKFQEWPPIYICVNEPIVFDQSAIDQDGDSIVYRLCTPLAGADPSIPMPQPPNNPPYDPITWVDPPYSESNMLNGSPGGAPLQIDAQTGLLTGLPNTPGQFVVGICVEEYRDGLLISTTRRDFQYNVGLCGEASAAFVAPEIQCDNLTVAFDNNSLGSSQYVWNFNDPGNPGATSTATDPIYTFSDTGLYNVMLIVAPGQPCEDTTFQEILLQANSLDANFEYDLGPCSDEVTITATDLSTDPDGAPQSWLWNLFPSNLSSTEQNPSFTVNGSDTYTLTLTVTAANGCATTLSETFEINLIDEPLIGEVTLCPGNGINLNPVFDASYDYQWSGSGIIDPNQPDPLVNPLETTTYQVTITDPIGGCEVVDSVIVNVPIPVVAEAPVDTVTCSSNILLLGNTNTGVSFLWAADAGFNTILSEEQNYSANVQGLQTFYFLARDTFGCTAVDSVNVTSNAVDITTASQEAVCPGDFGAVAVVNLDSNDLLDVTWMPEELIVAGQTATTAFAQLTEPGTYTFTATVLNQFGCTAVDSTTLTLIDTTGQIDFLSIVQCSDYTVQFNSTSTNAPFYVWSFGNPEQPDATGQGSFVSHTYPGSGTYDVMVTLNSFIQCPDTLLQEILVEEPNIIPAFTWEITNCADSLTINFTDNSINTQSDIIEWQWVFGNGQTASGPEVAITLTESQLLDVNLTIISSDGCEDETAETVLISIPQLTLPDALTACPGDSVALNPFASAEFTYQWSPAEVLADPEAINPLVAPDSTTVFSVIATSLDGLCVFEREVAVFVPPSFEYTVSSDTVICEGEVLLVADSPTNLDIIWSIASPNDTIFLGVGPELLDSPSSNTTYLVELSDEFGCTQREAIVVEYNPVLFFVRPNVAACLGDTVLLEAVNLLTDSLNYVWSPDELILDGQFTAATSISLTQDQLFTVVGTNEQGCSLTQTVNVSVGSSSPQAAITADADTLFAPGTVQLEATFNENYEYTWAPPQGLDNITIFNPTARIDSTFTYTVEVRDENGCSSTDTITIFFFSECLPPFVYLPNAFTPNGDQLNDLLLLRGSTVDEMYLAIYNRWGELIFETRNINQGWDGTYRGEALPPDAYAYYLEVRCFNGETFFDKGHINLIR